MNAESIVEDVARRLADPARVAAVVTEPTNVDRLPGQPGMSPWRPISLAEGHAGVALLFAELARFDPAHRRTAHEHLAAAATSVSDTTGIGLYSGLSALGFAAGCAARRPDEYRRLLETVDRRVREALSALLARRRGAGVDMHDYDVINGLAGVGRYLLSRGEQTAGTLAELLSHMVALTGPIEVDGRAVPGWWVPGSPSTWHPDGGRYRRGHFNMGLAHGIPGPLALLAVAWRAGHRVPGQDAAIARVVAWLLRWRQHDETGPFWPADVNLEEQVAGTGRPGPARLAWCYGTPGVARAVQLAGQALGRPGWTAAALEAMRSSLSRPESTWGVSDAALCHGWAGLLQTTWRVADDSGDAGFRQECRRLAARVAESYLAQAPFGFAHTSPHSAMAPNRAGFLEGAAGIALALLTYATGQPPRSGWDSALLLA